MTRDRGPARAVPGEDTVLDSGGVARQPGAQNAKPVSHYETQGSPSRPTSASISATWGSRFEIAEAVAGLIGDAIERDEGGNAGRVDALDRGEVERDALAAHQRLISSMRRCSLPRTSSVSWQALAPPYSSYLLHMHIVPFIFIPPAQVLLAFAGRERIALRAVAL